MSSALVTHQLTATFDSQGLKVRHVRRIRPIGYHTTDSTARIEFGLLTRIHKSRDSKKRPKQPSASKMIFFSETPFFLASALRFRNMPTRRNNSYPPPICPILASYEAKEQFGHQNAVKVIKSNVSLGRNRGF